MKRLLAFSNILVLSWTLALAVPRAASANRLNSSDKTSDAQAKLKAKAESAIALGEVAAKNHDMREAIANFKRAIELDPNISDAHERFIRTTLMQARRAPAPNPKKEKKLTKEQKEARDKKIKDKQSKEEAKLTAKLLATYDSWIRENPREAMFYVGKGEVYDYRDKDEDAAKQYEKAVAIDPFCAPAYESLSEIEATDGNVARQREYAEKALALDPKGAFDTFFYYSLTYLSTDPAKFRQLVEDRIAHYPEGLAFELELAAENANTPELEKQILEKAYQVYGPQSAHPSDSIDSMMTDLFNLYARSDPGKALQFAEQMKKDEAKKLAADAAKNKDKNAAKTKGNPPKPYWESVADFQNSVVAARSLLAQKKFAAARDLLEKHALKTKGEFDPLSSIDQTQFQLAQAEAFAGSGDAQKAFDTVKTALLPQPNSQLSAALDEYGATLGKSAEQASREIWQEREAKAKPMKPFQLEQYVTGKKIALSDYHGRVVLVNFWYPG